jgi:hypothetical protein
MTSMVLLCFSMMLVCCVMVSFSFRMSHASSSNFVPLPSLPLENSNLAVSLLPAKVVLSFL